MWHTAVHTAAHPARHTTRHAARARAGAGAGVPALRGAVLALLRAGVHALRVQREQQRVQRVRGDEVQLVAQAELLADAEVVHDAREGEGGVQPRAQVALARLREGRRRLAGVLGRLRGFVGGVRPAELLEEVAQGGRGVRRLRLGELLLAGAVEGEDLGPYGHEHRVQLRRRRLQQLEDVGEDADGEGEAHGPGAQLEEAAQQQQRAVPVRLREEHLQHHRQLLRRPRPRAAAEAQPHLEGGELLREEGARGKAHLAARQRGGLAPAVQQLREAVLHREVPARPEGVLGSVRQGRLGHGRAVQRAEHAVREEEVAEERGEEQVLAEEALEEAARQRVPRDRVRDGREDPVQLAERRLAVVQPPGDLVAEVRGHAAHAHLVLADEAAERDADRRRQAAREDVRRVLRAHRQQLLRAAGREHDGLVRALRLLVEVRHERARVAAVEDEDRRRARPALKVLHGERDVLREVLVEHPHLAGLRRPRHAVAVVVQEHAVRRLAPLARVPAQAQGRPLHVLDRRVHALLVPGARAAVPRAGDALELRDDAARYLVLRGLPV